MSSRKNDKFSMFVPEAETEQHMPDRLEILETGKAGVPEKRLQGGAYDPYQKQTPTGARSSSDTARVRKPRDLRKLSEWIKTTQRVKSLREQEQGAGTKRPPGKSK